MYTIHKKTETTLHRTSLDFAVIYTVLVLVTLFMGLVIWQFWHTNRIYQGISVGGVPIGGLTRAAAFGELQRRLQPYPVAPISLTHGKQQWPLNAQNLNVELDLGQAINRAYLMGRQGHALERWAQQFLVVLQGYEIQPDIAVDTAEMRAALHQIAKQIYVPGRAAEQVGELTVPAQWGIDVDVDMTMQSVLNMLGVEPTQATQRVAYPSTDHPMNLPLYVVELPPPDHVEQIRGFETDVSEGSIIGQQAANLLTPLLLRDEASSVELAIDASTLQNLVAQREPLKLDEAQLRELVEGWRDQFSVPAQNALLHFDPATELVNVEQESHPGRRLDVTGTIRAIEKAVANDEYEAPLIMETVAPDVDSNRVGEMGIRELVASGETYFAGSSAARIHNIEVAAAKFNGVVIPPNAIFSFNDVMVDVSAANGFEDSLIIWGDRTAVGVGGGVCQVSTTLFRAAYQAGLPIIERYNHGYVVGWYGEPGMDATIYTPTVDFRFRNDTGAYLLIEPVVQGTRGVITFNLYGTKPARTVIVSEPIYENVIQPKAPVYRVDESIEPGKRKQVEWAKNGMDVIIQRNITENGRSRTDKLTSRYQPWQAVYLVAPGSEIP